MAKSKLTIIGLGRTGASMGLALKKAGSELEIVGLDKNGQTAQQAQKRGAVDKTEWNLINACEGAGLVVLAMPLSGIKEALTVLCGNLAPGTLVTDTASIKTPVIEWARDLGRDIHFIGGHPISRPGPNAAPEASFDGPRADLFENGIYCLTPAASGDPDAVQVMMGFASMLGARPLFLDAAEHDSLVAGADHLPLVLSIALLKATTQSSGERELGKFVGRAFFNATALAANDAASNSALLLSQREPLLRWIDASLATLRELRAQITQNDPAVLEAWLAPLIAARERWLVGETEPAVTINYEELRATPMRVFFGGLVTRGGRDKKK